VECACFPNTFFDLAHLIVSERHLTAVTNMFSQTDFNTGKATEISSEEHNSNVEKV
jgi:hypothetical protein